MDKQTFWVVLFLGSFIIGVIFSLLHSVWASAVVSFAWGWWFSGFYNKQAK